jgi:hypothetical protein
MSDDRERFHRGREEGVLMTFIVLLIVATFAVHLDRRWWCENERTTPFLTSGDET